MNSYHSRLRERRSSAFTLVEIMIVVVIIGLLAAMAIPALKRVQQSARSSRFINDLRVFAQSFEQYALEHGTWPPNVGSGTVPVNMTTALQVSVWTSRNTLGGRWNWDRNFNFTAAVSTTDVTVTDEEMAVIDAKIDDGDLDTGNFRKVDSRFSYILEE
jgi:prepilin-type N-terminal cleavage/methylation domain-containing protein